MAIYRLTPLPSAQDSDKWDARVLEEGQHIWVRGATEDDARSTAATVLGFASNPNPRDDFGYFAGELFCITSPWADRTLTTCEIDNRCADVPPHTVTVSDGRRYPERACPPSDVNSDEGEWSDEDEWED